MRWFVSRHLGAKQWAKAQNIQVDQFVSHLDINAIKTGDHVIGNLPTSLAYQVCQRGARYFHLSLTLPANLRGKELTAAQMQHCKAQIDEYQVMRVSRSKPSR